MDTLNKPSILLVEDSEDDVFAMQRALKLSRVENPLQVVTDGQQALDYLTGTGKYADRAQHPLPFLIFLDLKLPYVSGFEILAWIQTQPELNSIPVVVLTGSAESRDQNRAYHLGARSYLIKPPKPEIVTDILKSLNIYWLSKASSTPLASQREPSESN